MPQVLSVGIVLPANNMGGPQKVSTIAALDLARHGHHVSLFLPVLPYHYYFVSLGRNRLAWLRAVLPYVRDWARGSKFNFQDIQDSPHQISVRFIARKIPTKYLKELDYLIIHSIAQLAEYKDSFLQQRQIYLLHHPEEHIHGHADEFSEMRRSFQGKIVTISPFTAGQVADHLPDPPVALNPISPIVWSQRISFDPERRRRDVLFFWKEATTGAQGSEVAKNLLERRPGTTLTIWCRSRKQHETAARKFPEAKMVLSLSEEELSQLYMDHSFLLFPSAYEGFGMPPVEAMACGCIPVLRPGVGVADLYARDGDNSVAWQGDSDALAQRVAALLNDCQGLPPMRRAAAMSIDAFNPEGYGLRLLEAGGAL